jgi:hypothetical protein
MATALQVLPANRGAAQLTLVGVPTGSGQATLPAALARVAARAAVVRDGLHLLVHTKVGYTRSAAYDASVRCTQGTTDLTRLEAAYRGAPLESLGVLTNADDEVWTYGG